MSDSLAYQVFAPMAVALMEWRDAPEREGEPAMELVYDIRTGRLLGQLVDIRPLTGMVRYLARGGGYVSVLAETVRIETV